MESALLYRVMGMGPKRAKRIVEVLVEEGFRMVADKSCDVETDDDIVFVGKNDVAKALSKTKGFGIVKSKKVINAFNVWIPIKLLTIEAFKMPTFSLTSLYLGESRF